jgi:glycosyltransferase involved in cell wall biosynthesis
MDPVDTGKRGEKCKCFEMKPTGQTLVILTPGFPANETDTTCLPAQQAFILALNRHFEKLTIIIISFQYPYTAVPYLWNTNRVIPLNGRNKGKFNRLQTWIGAWNTLKQVRKENELIGILNFWCTECALIGQRFGIKKGIKNYSWILGQDARKMNRFIRWIKPLPEHLLAMSPFLAGEFQRNHGVKAAHILPNGVDTRLFPPAGGPRDIDVLGVGSLIPLKQYDLFLRIIKKLQKFNPRLTCVICGKGPEEERLRKMILDHDLQMNVSIIGEKPHDEVLQWMSRCRIMLHPSSYEGFSSVCLEALYAGARVISFCDPMIGKVEHWDIAQNEEEMADLVLTRLQDPETDYGRVLVYSMDEMAEKLMSLFQHTGR